MTLSKQPHPAAHPVTSLAKDLSGLIACPARIKYYSDSTAVAVTVKVLDSTYQENS